jgi:hypothetical protein
LVSIIVFNRIDIFLISFLTKIKILFVNKMIQKLIVVSCAIIGSVMSKGITVCDLPTQWVGSSMNMTSFPEPLTNDYSSYILIDTPSQLSVDNTTCECSPVLRDFSYWMANGSWVPTENDDCVLDCDRCQVYYCVNGFQTSLLNSTNVTLNTDGEPTCILSDDDEEVTTTTDVSTPTDDVSIHVEVQIKDGDKTSNYTLVFPEEEDIVIDDEEDILEIA